jgi:hypothetical protein
MIYANRLSVSIRLDNEDGLVQIMSLWNAMSLELDGMVKDGGILAVKLFIQL